jgi:hypothetical protein
MTRRVFIACIGYSHLGAKYRVTDEDGRVLVASSRDPEFDVARVLLAEGVAGRLEVWRATGTEAAMYLDIEKAAGLTVEETVTKGPRMVKWVPSSYGSAGFGGSDLEIGAGMGRKHPPYGSKIPAKSF